MNKTAKIIVFSILTALYLAALVTLFIDFELGLVLWGIAFVPSLIVFLYTKHRESLKQTEEAEALKEQEEEKQ